MKYFAPAFTAASLAGLLVSAGTVAGAASSMYLVPVSDINATYKPGDKVTVKAMLDLDSNDFGSISVPTALAFSGAQFGAKPIVTLGGAPWGFSLVSSAMTTTGPYGQALNAVTATLSHIKSTAAIPNGNYMLATLTFSILPTDTDSAVSVYLPTAFGYGGGASATDGAYNPNTGPENLLRGKTMSNDALTNALTFPNSRVAPASLTFRVAPSAVPEPGSVALLMGMATLGASVLRRRRNR